LENNAESTKNLNGPYTFGLNPLSGAHFSEEYQCHLITSGGNR